MTKLLPLILAAGLICSCQQQPPRNIIQKEVPIYSITRQAPAKSSKKKRARKAKEQLQITMITVSGPESKDWDLFDRGDAIMKYNEMPLKDKEILFETVARVYSCLPKDNTLSSEDINTGIWKDVTGKGVDLSFGEDPADWHPYLMYIHPVVVAEMTNFFIHAKDGSITNAELDQWQKAGCNVINSRPDSISLASLLSRKKELAKAGTIITETPNGYHAHTVKVDWDKYRAEHHP